MTELARGSVRSGRAVSLWALLGFFLVASVVLVAVNTILAVNFFGDQMHELCRNVAEEYERDGTTSLRSITRGTSIALGPRIHLLDSAGRDVETGQKLPRPSFPPDLPRATVSVNGKNYSCTADLPPSRPILPLGPLFWVLPFISVLCCSVGGYIAWRMRRIEQVIQQFGAGALAVRVPPHSRDPIGRLAGAFNDMAERVESLIASHQRLCADMAHELRSPLTRLLLAIPGARRGSSSALECVEREAARMNDLVDELLDLARAEVDPGSLELVNLDIDSFLTEIADRCAIEAADRNCAIELVGTRRGVVVADVELLRRAVENVLRNAVQHSPEGSRIELFGNGDEQVATIAVRDRGPGVPEEALERIFQPFYRVDTARNRTTGGTGLGLSIAERAIRLHGGEIFAQNSSPGLTVTLRIPRGVPFG